jgi:hypothetical protein
MYRLSEQQIDFILDDIRARGVEMESLQHDLLDHICCIIEARLEENGDFGRFYENVITTFYKKELREIEEETIYLLENKNYYAMKKVMIISGVASSLLLTAGIILKFLHMPGAAVGIVVGITLFSLLFLPLMFALRLKEKKQSRDKLLLGFGSLVAIMMSMGVMFKIMHWPYANMLGMLSVAILILIYLPVNLVTGIRNPDTKVNTIVSSILLVAGCGLLMSLVRSPQGSREYYIAITQDYLRNESICRHEQQLTPVTSAGAREIIGLCEQLSEYILEMETGNKSIASDFEQKQAWLGETYAVMFFKEGSIARQQYDRLQDSASAYGRSVGNATIAEDMETRRK